jgi:hypothetical protein
MREGGRQLRISLDVPDLPASHGSAISVNVSTRASSGTRRAAALVVAALLVLTLVAASRAATPFTTPFTTTFELGDPAEVVATITARCDVCAWDVAGREAVTLAISLDDRYVAHLPLVRPQTAEYRVLVGRVPPGRHTIRVQPDPELTASALRTKTAASVERIQIVPIGPGHAEHTATSLAPFLYARPNTIGRFTDVPVFMWYEREPTARGTRYRYSVIFTNEDGGTPADRLMATWGRTTDIEYVYSVEVDQSGTIVADDLQGPDHKILAFGGTREDRHPLLWVSTDNNMVLDRGTTRVRYALAPVAFALEGVSREAVMDANPWLYAVAAQELTREGKIADAAPPGRGMIPDPRRFVYIEACGELGDAALAFEVRVRDAWERSDRGVPEYKIARSGCFRAAVPLRTTPRPGDVRGLRLVAFARPAKPGGPATVTTRAIRLDRINTVFMLDEMHRPGPALFRWTGPASIGVGAPFELPFTSP